MKAFDRYLQKVRIEKISRFIPDNSIVLDVGCGEGVLFKSLGRKIKKGIGIDPLLVSEIKTDVIHLVRGYFPDDLRISEKVDVITMLAVIEHFPAGILERLDDECNILLNNKGLVIISVPSPIVDKILDFLYFFRIIDGMSLEEHHGFIPNHTVNLFLTNFQLIKRKRFQLGLNNIFVFQKIK